MSTNDQQKYIDRAITVQSDVVRLQRRLPELTEKTAERYAEWIKILGAASSVYYELASEGNAWISAHHR